MCVAVVPCYNSSLLIMPILDSLGSEWLVSFYNSSLLIISVLGFPASEWL